MTDGTPTSRTRAARPLIVSGEDPKSTKPNKTREQFERDWLWSRLREIVDHPTHGGSRDKAMMRRHIGNCLRLIEQTNRQAIEREWNEYAAP